MNAGRRCRRTSSVCVNIWLVYCIKCHFKYKRFNTKFCSDAPFILTDVNWVRLTSSQQPNIIFVTILWVSRHQQQDPRHHSVLTVNHIYPSERRQRSLNPGICPKWKSSTLTANHSLCVLAADFRGPEIVVTALIKELSRMWSWVGYPLLKSAAGTH